MTTATSAEVDYRPLVAAAFGAAAWLLVVKVLAVLVAASAVGATVQVAMALGLFPYLAIAGTTPQFTAVVTASVVAMAAGAAAIVLRPAVRPGWRRQVVRGRAVGVVLAFETLLFELGRHWVVPPVVQTEFVWIGAVVLIAGVSIAAAAVRRAQADAAPETG